MARFSLGLCLILIVASSVIYEAQGTFLLKHYLKKNFPGKCSEFTPYANKGIMTLVSDLEGGCPPTAEFKSFFTSFKSYMSFVESTSATSKNVDVEITSKADELFKAMSALSSGQGGKSADAGSFKATMISMAKTLVEEKKNTKMMTVDEKKKLATAMVKWTKMLATFVKSASEKKGKTIDIKSYGLDVDVNDTSFFGTSSSGKSSSSTKFKSSTSTKTESESSGSRESASSKTKQIAGGRSGNSSGSQIGSPVGSPSSKTSLKGSASVSSGTGSNFKDTTGSASRSASPTGSPSGKTSEKGSGNASLKGKESNKGSETSSKTGTFKDTTGSASPIGSPSAKGSSSATNKSDKKTSTKSSTSTLVKQVETETSKEAMSFIMELEKRYSGNAELKVFFEKLKASMTACSTVSSKTAKDYVSGTRLATDKLSEAMALLSSRYSKSAKMKSNMETSQEQLMKTLKELQDINAKIVNEKTVTSTQKTEIKQKITKWEQVTTQYVETAASSSSSSSSSSQQSAQSN